MPPLPPPPGFGGVWLTGPEAHTRASRISGPFRAEPTAYAVPRSVEEVGHLVEYARAEGVSIVPRGAGTGMPAGNLGPGIVVSLNEGLRQVGPVEGNRIRVEAGCTALQVEEAAEAADLTLPALPSSAQWCTVGGMVANNAAGARSFGHGPTSSRVVALEGILASGNHFVARRNDPAPGPFEGLARKLAPLERALPERIPLRKNSSGYAWDRYRKTDDPAQLLVGSEGTLALITAATLRLAPRPETRGVQLLPVGDPDQASELALEVAEIGAVACEFLGRRFLEVAELLEDPLLADLPAPPYALYLVEFEGSTDAVESGLEAARSLGRRMGIPGELGRLGSSDPDQVHRLWALRHRASPIIARQARFGRISTQFIEDSVVPPSRLGAYLTGLEEILGRHEIDAVIFGHAGDGNVHVNPLIEVEAPDWLQRVRRVLDETVELVAHLGGTLAGEHGDGRLRAPFMERIWGPEWSRLFREIKDHFDPLGCFNPGVIVPLPGQDPLNDFEPRPRSWPI